MNERTNISDELRAAIEVAKQRVEVDSYHNLAANNGLKGHGKGYWAGTIIGLALGASIGGLLALVSSGAALPILGIAAATGAGLGGVIGSRVGISASAIAGVMAEKERREKGKELEAEILNNPAKQAEVLAAYRQDPVVKKDNTMEELFETHSVKEAWSKVITPKAWAITIAAGAALGALIFGLPFAPDAGGASAFLVKTLGVETALGAAGMGAVAGAGVGMSFGLYMPGVLTSLSNKVGKMLSGEMFDELRSGKSKEKTQVITTGAVPVVATIIGKNGCSMPGAKNGCNMHSQQHPASTVQAGDLADQARLMNTPSQQHSV